MSAIGAFDAKNRLGHLLDAAERGEETVITRHGRPVARLIPVLPASDRKAAHAALERIRARARGLAAPPSLEELRAWREEGRR